VPGKPAEVAAGLSCLRPPLSIVRHGSPGRGCHALTQVGARLDFTWEPLHCATTDINNHQLLQSACRVHPAVARCCQPSHILSTAVRHVSARGSCRTGEGREPVQRRHIPLPCLLPTSRLSVGPGAAMGCTAKLQQPPMHCMLPQPACWPACRAENGMTPPQQMPSS